MDRKQEMERKRAKLAALREEKKRKEEEKKKASQTGDSPRPEAAGDLRRDAEGLLNDLGISTTSPAVAPPAAYDGGSTTQAAAVGGEMSAPVASLSKKKVMLTTSKVTQTNIPPKENVSYCKETQTPQQQIDKEDDDMEGLDGHEDAPPPPGHTGPTGRMPQVEAPKPAETPVDALASPKEEEKPQPVRELTEEEKEAAINSEDFQRFFDRATRIIERALDEKNVLTDYAGTDEDDQEGGLQEGEQLKLNRQFFDERWSKHRTVTCMDWSTQYPELLVASYNNNEESPHEPDGVALVWNIKYKKNTPEYIFHCQSAVMSTCFAKFHPNLLIGGTYSGQIVLWDNRSNKRTPVQRTPLSASAHTHPVYCVNVVGTQNAHNLMSVSTDGKMCSWSLDMLSQPQDSMELLNKQAKSVAVTSFSFLSGDVNNFVVGSEEGVVYTACRHGSKAGINDQFEGHVGPVTGIDCNSVPGAIDFSQYFITSSFDWTVKLWNIKENRPLHSFEDNSEYVYDAKWSPINPALFATVDISGRLDMWNLNNDTEVPTASTVVESNVALNKVLWHSSGQHIAVGDDLGKIHVYDVGEKIAMPRNDEWQRFVNTLQDLKTEQADQDDDISKPLR